MVTLKNEKTFRYFNIFLALGGVPIYNGPKSFLYTIYVIMIVCFSYSTAFALCVKLYYSLDDMDGAADAINTLPPIVLSFWIQIYLRVRRESVEKLVILADSFSWEDLPLKDPVTENASMASWIRTIRKTATSVLVSAFSFHVIQSVGRMIFNEKRPLSLDGVYPYDTKKTPAYELTNTVQLIGSIGYVAVLYVFPSFYATLSVIVCTQLEKLRALLSNIKQKRDDGEELQTPEEKFAYMQRQLNECIRLHQAILSFTSEMEETFHPLFVGVFIIQLIALCLASYSAVLRWGNVVNLSQSFVAYSVYLTFIFLFCWFPSELADQAERIRDAAWGCDWVGTPVPFQRALSFMIVCANKELVMTAGKCVPVSKQTMMSMIQESFSLFMFLLQVRDKEENEV